MTRDEKEFVSALRTLLRERVGDGRYELWFGESTHMTCVGQALCVSAPNQLVLEWLQRSFRNDLQECLREITGEKRGLRFQLDESTASHATGNSSSKSSEQDQAISHQPAVNELSRSPSKEPAAFSTIPMGNFKAQNKPKLPARESENSSARSSANPIQATTRRFASLDDYVVGDSNRAAFKSAEIVLQQPGVISPYFVYGPSAVGKTHLLEGIWSQARKSGQSAVFLTAEQFTSSFVAALRGGGMPNFRRKYRGVDILLIDDLQFICGKNRTEEELLYTIDSLARDGRQVILAADRQPSELAGLGPELQTRLQAGLACQLSYPSLAERAELVQGFAKQRSLELTDDITQLIAERINSHARELSGAVNRLFATTLATGEKITLQSAMSTLGESVQRLGPQFQLKEIEKAVCQEFQLEPKQLRSSRKTQDVSQPRMLAMWLARKYTRAALSEIGSYFGGRSHSTVVSAQKKVNHWVESHQALQCNSGGHTADEAVRRLEARLRVG